MSLTAYSYPLIICNTDNRLNDVIIRIILKQLISVHKRYSADEKLFANSEDKIEDYIFQSLLHGAWLKVGRAGRGPIV